jgi:hypothetical protein
MPLITYLIHNVKKIWVLLSPKKQPGDVKVVAQGSGSFRCARGQIEIRGVKRHNSCVQVYMRSNLVDCNSKPNEYHPSSPPPLCVPESISTHDRTMKDGWMISGEETIFCWIPVL